jgi:hypothetical protein
VAKKSRHLACKAEWDKLYIYAKPTLRVSPYFQVLPSNLDRLNVNIQAKLLNFKQDKPGLSQTRVVKQVLKQSININSLINIITSISYVMMTTSQAVTQIDVHPAGET